ncbi:MAG: hypothetical protein KGH98_00125 [Candidatus Micrarchaeota archaeon]|nr:hypothetical protein [Candidatus Micrarchaeota archaeon]
MGFEDKIVAAKAQQILNIADLRGIPYLIISGGALSESMNAMLTNYRGRNNFLLILDDYIGGKKSFQRAIPQPKVLCSIDIRNSDSGIAIRHDNEGTHFAITAKIYGDVEANPTQNVKLFLEELEHKDFRVKTVRGLNRRPLLCTKQEELPKGNGLDEEYMLLAANQRPNEIIHVSMRTKERPPHRPITSDPAVKSRHLLSLIDRSGIPYVMIPKSTLLEKRNAILVGKTGEAHVVVFLNNNLNGNPRKAICSIDMSLSETGLRYEREGELFHFKLSAKIYGDGNLPRPLETLFVQFGNRNVKIERDLDFDRQPFLCFEEGQLPSEHEAKIEGLRHTIIKGLAMSAEVLKEPEKAFGTQSQNSNTGDQGAKLSLDYTISFGEPPTNKQEAIIEIRNITEKLFNIRRSAKSPDGIGCLSDQSTAFKFYLNKATEYWLRKDDKDVLKVISASEHASSMSLNRIFNNEVEPGHNGIVSLKRGGSLEVLEQIANNRNATPDARKNSLKIVEQARKIKS